MVFSDGNALKLKERHNLQEKIKRMDEPHIPSIVKLTDGKNMKLGVFR